MINKSYINFTFTEARTEAKREREREIEPRFLLSRLPERENEMKYKKENLCE